MRRNVVAIALLLLVAFCAGIIASVHIEHPTTLEQGDALTGFNPERLYGKFEERLDASAIASQSVNEANTTESDSVPLVSGDDNQTNTRAYTSWTEDDCPHYYRIVGDAEMDANLQPGEVSYSGLDHLGRSGCAVACVTYDLMVEGIARSRNDMSSITPSGWGHNEVVDIELPDGSYYHGYLFNRSHLIAKSLGGSDIQENLVTGTRMQNVGANNPAGGMLFCEQTARDWLENNPEGWILYSATPVYEGDELVCRSVIVNMLSSDGAINMQVEVYNAAQGFEINYGTGEFTTVE